MHGFSLLFCATVSPKITVSRHDLQQYFNKRALLLQHLAVLNPFGTLLPFSLLVACVYHMVCLLVISKRKEGLKICFWIYSRLNFFLKKGVFVSGALSVFCIS